MERERSSLGNALVHQLPIDGVDWVSSQHVPTYSYLVRQPHQMRNRSPGRVLPGAEAATSIDHSRLAAIDNGRATRQERPEHQMVLARAAQFRLKTDVGHDSAAEDDRRCDERATGAEQRRHPVRPAHEMRHALKRLSAQQQTLTRMFTKVVDRLLLGPRVRKKEISAQ